MKFSTKTVATGVEILAADDYTAIPIKVAGSTAVAAGTPLTAAGAVATITESASDAAGVLLYDVNPAENPNAALLVAGVVDWTKCMSHASVSTTAARMKAILPAIEFRTNVGVNA